MSWPRRSFCRSRSARFHSKPLARIESLLSCALFLLLENCISTLYYGSAAIGDTRPLAGVDFSHSIRQRGARTRACRVETHLDTCLRNLITPTSVEKVSTRHARVRAPRQLETRARRVRR